MIKYLPLLLLLSCNPAKDELYHSIGTNIYCKEFIVSNGIDCYSMSSGKKFKKVYNLTNVVRVK